LSPRARKTSSKVEEEIFLVENDRTFGLSEAEIVLDLQSGVRELLDIENRLKSDEVPVPEEKPAPTPKKSEEPKPKFKIKLTT
jgi:hypothetical protein